MITFSRFIALLLAPCIAFGQVLPNRSALGAHAKEPLQARLLERYAHQALTTPTFAARALQALKPAIREARHVQAGQTQNDGALFWHLVSLRIQVWAFKDYSRAIVFIDAALRSAGQSVPDTLEAKVNLFLRHLPPESFINYHLRPLSDKTFYHHSRVIYRLMQVAEHTPRQDSGVDPVHSTPKQNFRFSPAPYFIAILVGPLMGWDLYSFLFAPELMSPLGTILADAYQWISKETSMGFSMLLGALIPLSPRRRNFSNNKWIDVGGFLQKTVTKDGIWYRLRGTLQDFGADAVNASNIQSLVVKIESTKPELHFALRKKNENGIVVWESTPFKLPAGSYPLTFDARNTFSDLRNVIAESTLEIPKDPLEALVRQGFDIEWFRKKARTFAKNEAINAAAVRLNQTPNQKNAVQYEAAYQAWIEALPDNFTALIVRRSLDDYVRNCLEYFSSHDNEVRQAAQRASAAFGVLGQALSKQPIVVDRGLVDIETMVNNHLSQVSNKKKLPVAVAFFALLAGLIYATIGGQPLDLAWLDPAIGPGVGALGAMSFPVRRYFVPNLASKPPVTESPFRPPSTWVFYLKLLFRPSTIPDLLTTDRYTILKGSDEAIGNPSLTGELVLAVKEIVSEKKFLAKLHLPAEDSTRPTLYSQQVASILQAHNFDLSNLSITIYVNPEPDEYLKIKQEKSQEAFLSSLKNVIKSSTGANVGQQWTTRTIEIPAEAKNVDGLGFCVWKQSLDDPYIRTVVPLRLALYLLNSFHPSIPDPQAFLKPAEPINRRLGSLAKWLMPVVVAALLTQMPGDVGHAFIPMGLLFGLGGGMRRQNPHAKAKSILLDALEKMSPDQEARFADSTWVASWRTDERVRSLIDLYLLHTKTWVHEELKARADPIPPRLFVALVKMAVKRLSDGALENPYSPEALALKESIQGDVRRYVAIQAFLTLDWLTALEDPKKHGEFFQTMKDIGFLDHSVAALQEDIKRLGVGSDIRTYAEFEKAVNQKMEGLKNSPSEWAAFEASVTDVIHLLLDQLLSPNDDAFDLKHLTQSIEANCINGSLFGMFLLWRLGIRASVAEAYVGKNGEPVSHAVMAVHLHGTDERRLWDWMENPGTSSQPQVIAMRRYGQRHVMDLTTPEGQTDFQHADNEPLGVDQLRSMFITSKNTEVKKTARKTVDYLLEYIKNEQKALEADPSSYVAHYNLGVAYQFLNRLNKSPDAFDQAIKHFTAAIQLNPFSPDVYTQRGRTYLDRRHADPNLAIADFTAALQGSVKQSKERKKALEHLIQALAIAGRTEQLNDAARQLAREFPHHLKVWWTLAHSEWALGRWKNAAAALLAAIGGPLLNNFVHDVPKPDSKPPSIATTPPPVPPAPIVSGSVIGVNLAGPRESVYGPPGRPGMTPGFDSSLAGSGSNRTPKLEPNTQMHAMAKAIADKLYRRNISRQQIETVLQLIKWEATKVALMGKGGETIKEVMQQIIEQEKLKGMAWKGHATELLYGVLQIYPQTFMDGVGAAQNEGTKYLNRNVSQEDTYITAVNTHAGVRMAAAIDGMGGHGNGALAAQIIRHGLLDALYGFRFRQGMKSEEVRRSAQNVFEGLVDLLDIAFPNLSVSDAPGATVALFLELGDDSYIIKLGDARAYVRYSDKAISRITRDHSSVEALYGIAPKDVDLSAHPMRNIITRGVMAKNKTQIDLTDSDSFQFLSGKEIQLLILTSDGPTDEFAYAAHKQSHPDAHESLTFLEELLEPVRNESAFAIAERLIATARSIGDQLHPDKIDNLTAVVINKAYRNYYRFIYTDPIAIKLRHGDKVFSLTHEIIRNEQGKYLLRNLHTNTPPIELPDGQEISIPIERLESLSETTLRIWHSGTDFVVMQSPAQAGMSIRAFFPDVRLSWAEWRAIFESEGRRVSISDRIKDTDLFFEKQARALADSLSGFYFGGIPSTVDVRFGVVAIPVALRVVGGLSFIEIGGVMLLLASPFMAWVLLKAGQALSRWVLNRSPVRAKSLVAMAAMALGLATGSDQNMSNPGAVSRQAIDLLRAA